MTLPNFVIVGTPKAGSTTLYRYLGHHPDVFMPARKELDFFNRRYRRGTEWYEQQFEDASDERAIGEGSVLYSINCLWPEVPHRLHALLPECRLLYLVRHPIDRLESLWCQHIGNGDRIPEFTLAVREWRPLLEGSLYWYQLEKFLRYFPEERVQIILFEELIGSPIETMQRCFSFLGVDPSAGDPSRSEHVNPRAALKTDRAIWARLRHTSLGLAVRRGLPEPVKDVFRRFLRRGLATMPRWDETTLRWAVEQIEPDARRFLSHAGLPDSTWDFGGRWMQGKLEKSGPAPTRRRPFVLAALDFYDAP